VVSSSFVTLSFIGQSSFCDQTQEIRQNYCHSAQMHPTKSAFYFSFLKDWFRRCVEEIQKWFFIITRCIYLSGIFTIPFLSLPVPVILSKDNTICKLWWQLLRSCIRASGPCGMKFAQWIATRPDLFPLIICQNVQELQRLTLSKPKESQIIRELEREFGKNWVEQIQLEYKKNDSPELLILGSGCVASVIKAKLLRSNEDIAIKVIQSGNKMSDVMHVLHVI
jgi:predicted unusual protein kinase regulating ubiquinone biosynthesis (AarF/ABC1/UbiB family)